MAKVSDRPNSICVVLDTNIWVYKTSLLRTVLGAALTNALLRVEGSLGLPEVVEEEIVKHTVKVGRGATAEIVNNSNKIAGLIGWVDENWYSVPSEDQFESSARERLLELAYLIERVPFNLKQAKSALWRVMDETPPNGPKNQQYKDSVIWEAVLELSENYVVHFITEDKGFFEGRNPSKGLASNLKADCNIEGRSIFVHYELEAYLKSLRETVPPLDHRHLASEIDRALGEDLTQISADHDFELGEVIDWHISAFLTENAEDLALSFELVHRASVVLPSEGEIPARLVTNGECSYNLREGTISEVRKDSVQLLNLDGDLIEGKAASYIYASGVSIGGPRRRPYSIRERLEEE